MTPTGSASPSQSSQHPRLGPQRGRGQTSAHWPSSPRGWAVGSWPPAHPLAPVWHRVENTRQARPQGPGEASGPGEVPCALPLPPAPQPAASASSLGAGLAHLPGNPFWADENYSKGRAHPAVPSVPPPRLATVAGTVSPGLGAHPLWQGAPALCIELGTSHQPGSCCIGPETPESEHLVVAAQGPTVTKGRDCPVPAGLRRLHPHHHPASAPSPLLPGTEQPRPDRRAGKALAAPGPSPALALCQALSSGLIHVTSVLTAWGSPVTALSAPWPPSHSSRS